MSAAIFVKPMRVRRFRSTISTTILIQDNQSNSARAGTVRGLHFQQPPFAQAKLVRVLSGRIVDVVVDLRRSFGELRKACRS